MRAILAAFVVLAAGSTVWAQTSAEPEARQELKLRDGWRFSPAGAQANVEPRASADSWSNVSVPHTWNRVGAYIADTPGRVNTPDKLNKTQGVGWYRLSFTPPASYRGKKAWLQFDAVSRIAEVWLNGVRLGAHEGGFSRFRFDASVALKPGQENILVVKANNAIPAAGGPTQNAFPLSGDFFVHGGIYRPVTLVATHVIHFDMLDFGGPGVYAATRSVSGDSATVAVRARLTNDSRSTSRVELVSRLVDDKGVTAATIVRTVTLRAGETQTVESELAVAKARLWQGVADPYLYELVSEIRRPGGAVLDRIGHPFGIREIRIDPNQGFFLNGKHVRLHGVGMHQDLEGKGWAMTEADIAADVEMLRDLGANTIRLTHYQHGSPVHDLADKYGLILWDEIPIVGQWLLGEQQVTPPSMLANAKQQMQELIRQNYNHPSVAMWGIANELDLGRNYVVLPGQPLRTPLPLLEELNRFTKAEDPTRPTTQANCCEGRGAAGDPPIVAPAAELNGANRYFGWYYGAIDDLGPHLDGLRATRPDQPLSVSEYGAGGAITMHTDNPLGGPVDSRGRKQPEEYETITHERQWAIMDKKPYLFATWVWNAFDFATSTRHEGDSDDINTKGLVTYDRKVKKDAFFFYRANWSAAPTIHITGRRYVERAYDVVDVRVYSNAPSTEASVNGRSLGVRTNCAYKICVWSNIRLDAGDNEVVAIGRFPQGETQDRIRWRVAPEAAGRYRIDSGAILAPATASKKFGSDNFFDGGAAGALKLDSEKSNVAGTQDSDIAITFREGDFRYRIPVANGLYNVRLTFVEPGAAAGERIFNVIANEQSAISRLDVAAAAGKPLTAVSRVFAVRVNSGQLDLHFRPVKGKAIVSAVEVEPR